MLLALIFAASIRFIEFSRVQNPTIMSYRRMTSMKFVRMTILALGLVALAAATSFAAVPFLTTSTTNMVASNAQTGLAGSIFYYPSINGTVAQGEVVNIVYPLTITYISEISVAISSNNGAVREYFGAAPVGTPFTHTPVAGNAAFTAYGQVLTSAPASSGISVTLNQQSILLSFNQAVNFFQNMDFISVGGVRLDFSAFSGSTVSASLSNTFGQALESNNSLIIATLTEALATPTVAGVSPLLKGINFYSSFPKGTNTGSVGSVPYNGAPQNLVTVTLAELFPNGFDTKGGNVAGQNTSTQLKLDLGTLPTGLTLSGVNLAVSGGTVAVGNANNMGGTYYPNSTNPVLLNITTSSKNAYESVVVGLTFSVTTGVTSIALAPGDINFTATLAPTAPTVPTGAPPPAVVGAVDLPYDNPRYQMYQSYFTPFNSKGAYRFAAKTVAGTIKVTITGLQTNLLSVFNEMVKDPADPTKFLYDTGFGISNTSGTAPIPPGQIASATGAPASLPGAITVTLYPMDGLSSAKSFTTGSDSALRPGVWPAGVSNGTLGPGQSWIVLLSSLVQAAGYPSTMTKFYGFIRFQCNFQGGAGINYIADGDFSENGTAQGYIMLSDVPATPNGGSGITAGYF